MKNRALDARTHTFTATDAILPDANIWLYLNGPAAATGSWAVSAYAAIFANVLTAKARLFLDVLVLGEFINRYARMEWERLDPPDRVTRKRVYRTFKDFRGSPVFPKVAKDIAGQATVIVNACQRLDHIFSQWDMVALLNDYATGHFDCNDQLLVESCRKHGLHLLTNDADFTEGGIPVFTANGKLLTACPP
jgi:predicted nucleic acid-binding protein